MDTQGIDFYKKYGYIVLKNVISHSAIEKLLALTHELMTNASIEEKHKNLYLYDAIKNQDTKTYKKLRRILSPEIIHPFFGNVIKDKNLLSNLASLLGNNIRLDGCNLSIKHEYCQAKKWHQDWAFQSYTNDDALTVGILLDDSNEDNSPLCVLPKTHTDKVYRHEANGFFSGSIDIERENISLDRTIPLCGKIGDVILHHYRLLHYSPANTSGKARKLFYLRYVSANAWPLMGILDYNDGFSFEKMKSRIVLGEQTSEPKLKEVPVFLPLPYPKKYDDLNSEPFMTK